MSKVTRVTIEIDGYMNNIFINVHERKLSMRKLCTRNKKNVSTMLLCSVYTYYHFHAVCMVFIVDFESVHIRLSERIIIILFTANPSVPDFFFKYLARAIKYKCEVWYKFWQNKLTRIAYNEAYNILILSPVWESFLLV